VEEPIDQHLLDDRPDEDGPERGRVEARVRRASAFEILMPETNSIVMTRWPDSSS
jgi:hypothetical protein